MIENDSRKDSKELLDSVRKEFNNVDQVLNLIDSNGSYNDVLKLIRALPRYEYLSLCMIMKIKELESKVLVDVKTTNNYGLQKHQMDYIIRLARSGKKIEAIKEHRVLTGAGLKESKDWVEANA